MIQQVFRTEDSMVFDTLEEAEKHVATEVLKFYLREHAYKHCCDADSACSNAEDIAEYLVKYYDQIKEIMEGASND